MSINSAGLWATAFIVLLGLGACRSDSVQGSLEAAKLYIEKKDYSAALIELKSAVLKSPDSGRPRYLMGQVLIEQGQFAAGLFELNKAIELGYDEDEVHAKKATALLGLGKIKELQEIYGARSLESDAARAQLLTALAVANFQERRFDLAERALEDALKAVPNFGWALLIKARLAFYKGDDTAGRKLIDLAIRSEQVNGEAWFMKGALLQSRDRDMKGAERAYQEARKDPRFENYAQTALVNIFISQGRRSDIEVTLKEMKKLYPKHPSTLLVEAQLAYLDKDITRCRELLDRLLQGYPNDLRLLLFAGTVDIERRSYLTAEAALSKAVMLSSGSSPARRLLASVQLRIGQADKALETLQPLIEGRSNDHVALAMAGEASLLLGRHGQAEEFLTAASRLSPNDSRLRTSVALIDLARGEIASGIAMLESIAVADPSDIADKVLISAHLRRREIAQALFAIDRLEKKSPTKADSRLYRGLVLKAKGDLVGSKAAFVDALKVEPANSLAIVNLAQIEQMQGQTLQARQRMEAAIKSRPSDTSLRLTYVNMLRSQGEGNDTVLRALADGVRAVPTDLPLQVALVDHLLARRDTVAALGAAQRLWSMFPSSPLALDAIGRAQGDAGDDEQALRSFEKWATVEPKNPLPRLRVADIYGKRRQLSQASINLQRAFDLSPENDQVLRRMLAFGLIARDMTLPIKAALALQKKFPDRVIGYFLEGDAEAGRKNWAAAIAAFRKAIGKSDGGSFPQIRIYDAYLASGQSSQAEKFGSDWMRTNPKDFLFLEHLADISIRQKAFRDAERQLTKALEIQPRSVVALNNLAWVEAQRAAPEAVARAKSALALMPGSPPILDTLARALAATKDLKGAIEAQENAVAGAPTMHFYRLSLAKLYLAQGNRERAHAELVRLRQLGNSFGGHQEVETLEKSLQTK